MTKFIAIGRRRFQELSEGDLNRYFAVLSKRGVLPRWFSLIGNFRFYLDFLFQGVDFVNKRMIDIGAGTGVYSFYAAIKGAREVISLEPELAGATSSALSTFSAISVDLGLTQVRLQRQMLQAYASDGECFDIILLNNSINHLDESACMNLLRDPVAVERYRALFRKLSSIANVGGTLIVTDCMDSNFFARLRLRNPFAPTIEWQKHQHPKTWAHLLAEAGFANPDVQWTPPTKLGTLGKALLGNETAAFFLTSHFRLAMDKPRIT